jgi:hypothetical protein
LPVRAGGFSLVANGAFCSVSFSTYVSHYYFLPKPRPLTLFSFPETRSVLGRKKRGFPKWLLGIMGILGKVTQVIGLG